MSCVSDAIKYTPVTKELGSERYAHVLMDSVFLAEQLKVSNESNKQERADR